MRLTTKEGQKSVAELPVSKGLERDLGALNINQKKAYKACLKSFKGLSHYEAQRILYVLGDTISQNAAL